MRHFLKDEVNTYLYLNIKAFNVLHGTHLDVLYPNVVKIMLKHIINKFMFFLMVLEIPY